MADITIDQNIPEIDIESVAASYHLPIASATTLGGIKVGDNLTIEEDGTLNAESTEYILPTATTTTLGGIKVGNGLSINNSILSVNVDQSLDGASTNPVENRVLTANIDELISTTQTLSSDVSDLSGNYTNLSDTVAAHTSALSTMSDTVEAQGLSIQANTDSISAQDSTITANTSDISDLDDRLDTVEDSITSINSSLETLNDDDLITLDYTDLQPSSTWTSGNIFIVKRGKLGYVYIDIEGSLTIAANSSEVLYTFSDIIPLIKANATLSSDGGSILGEFDDYTYNLSLVNLGSSSITLTKVKGCIPIVFA